MELAIRKFALQNALQHGGQGQRGAVMSRVLGTFADLRARAGDVAQRVQAVLDEVNALGPEAQRAELESSAPELLEARPAERPGGLPDLMGAADGKVVMRMAPGPSGPLHIGHARAAVLNDVYVRRYRGKYILRLEDTDPARVTAEAYRMIQEDMEWLGCQVHETVIQSDRFARYYEVARRLLEMGKAYVCTDPPDAWRELKEQGRPCPHRGADPAGSLEAFEAMLSGVYKAREAAVVAVTEIDHPNPALRDFPLLRIEDTPHPRTGTKYRVYPLMNFSVSVDDHDLGLTHVLRGKDHLNNTHRQDFLFRYLGWRMPVYIHYGRVSVEGVELSTSKMAAGIAAGTLAGWDDPRLGTIRALARRGYRPESLRAYWVDAGVKEVDVVFSWKNLDAIDKKAQDPGAHRVFLVEDPVPVELDVDRELVARPPRLPSRPEAGRRVLRVGAPAGATRPRVLIPREDLEALGEGQTFRLKDLANFVLSGPGRARFESIGHEEARGAPILHWLPDDPSQTAEAEVVRPDGSTRQGRIERAGAESGGRVVQLERVGFARVEVEGAAAPRVRAFFLYR
ncbi:MAG TPA: glutamate--tRNA ligase [Candidatus Thermoplasmatota archaeon]